MWVAGMPKLVSGRSVQASRLPTAPATFGDETDWPIMPLLGKAPADIDGREPPQPALLHIINMLDGKADPSRGPLWASAYPMVANGDQSRAGATGRFKSLPPQPIPYYRRKFGSESATSPADELIAGWSANLGPSKTSFHLRGSHRVTFTGLGEVVMPSHGYAWNRLEAGTLAEKGGTAMGGLGHLRAPVRAHDEGVARQRDDLHRPGRARQRLLRNTPGRRGRR